MLELLGHFRTFEKDYKNYKRIGSNFIIPQRIKSFYPTDIFKEVLESALFSLEKKRNIIIVGEWETGKSHIAREIVECYNSKINKKKFYHFICTEETKCSDLFGYIAPQKSSGTNEGDINMEWREGFLSKAIENGFIAILDNLHEVNSTITERLNGLLYIKYDEKKKKSI